MTGTTENKTVILGVDNDETVICFQPVYPKVAGVVENEDATTFWSPRNRSNLIKPRNINHNKIFERWRLIGRKEDLSLLNRTLATRKNF